MLNLVEHEKKFYNLWTRLYGYTCHTAGFLMPDLNYSCTASHPLATPNVQIFIINVYFVNNYVYC